MTAKYLPLLNRNVPSLLAILSSSLTAGSSPLRSAADLGIGARSDNAGFFARRPLIWLERACFRAKLRADLKDGPDLLRDIGISLHEAQAEASRFFWEPVVLRR
ncbi:hypothetical protein FXB40_11585 [Bradyrhizobium rifense]|uniref:DUF1127 domain-containing protein n=1 Tax=Bradyrhizobium rifense TaxID=515499 RepID=A0A5D3KLG2_9BRAD|nr:hypothetical protein [Bradyrhizobium rifense]TYL96669.1 hypothetical protein FXB40_11585 [Bradyrhizobium rifense]